MQQLGANEQGYVSYAQFILCHNKLQWSSHLTSDTMEQNSSDKSQVFRRRDAKNASGMKLLRRQLLFKSCGSEFVQRASCVRAGHTPGHFYSCISKSYQAHVKKYLKVLKLMSIVSLSTTGRLRNARHWDWLGQALEAGFLRGPSSMTTAGGGAGSSIMDEKPTSKEQLLLQRRQKLLGQTEPQVRSQRPPCRVKCLSVAIMMHKFAWSRKID